MRRFVAFTLVALMLLSLCACSSSDLPKPKANLSFPYKKGALNITATAKSDYTMTYEQPDGPTHNTLFTGDQVIILSIDEEWACTDQGWILLETLEYDKVALENPIIDDDTVSNTDIPVETTTPTETTPVNSPPATFANALTACVTGDNLCVRNNPGTSARKQDSLDTGHYVTILGISYVNDTLWAYIQYKNKGGTFSGWVSMDFLQLNDYNMVSSFPVYFSNATPIYTNPGQNDVSFGSVDAGNTITIRSLRMVNNAMWGRTDSGWVELTYATLPGNIQLAEGYTT